MLSLFLLTVAGVVFRSEIAVLVFTQTLFSLLTHKVSLLETITPAGIGGLAVGLTLTVPVDSFFWQQFPLWPEWTSFYYNTIQGKSSEWGVSPWHFYFASSLPRLLMATVAPLPLALALPSTRSRAFALLIPAISFVAIYSILPHKEWRFIIYIVPALTSISALGASWIWTRRSKNIFYRLLSLGLIACVLLNFAVSTTLLMISSLNYPGGNAALRLEELVRAQGHNGTVSVFADNLTCQTGLTRFLEGRITSSRGLDSGRGPKVVFSKSENQTLLLLPGFWMQFDYALAEDQERCIGAWELVDSIPAYSGIRMVQPGQELRSQRSLIGQRVGADFEARIAKLTGGWLPQVKMDPRIHVLKRQKDIDGHESVVEIAS
jgi:alpha-1,6-mannosyltransferase